METYLQSTGEDFLARVPLLIDHLLRRAGFGATSTERAAFGALSYTDAVDALVNYDPATDIDGAIGTPGYVGITTRGQFSPNQVINDSRQRWLFRMVHSPAPLQEKMALFWHHHAGCVFSELEHNRCPPALAVQDGTQRPSAPGKDGAVLAQPLRDRAGENRRHAGRD